MSRWAASMMLVSLVGGCDDARSPEGAPAVSPREKHKNTPALNSASLNGFTLNGFTLNGFTLNGFTLNGFTLNGIDVEGFTLEGSSFTGYQDINGVQVPVSAVDFAGAEIKLLHEGSEFVLIFDDVYLDPAHPAGDVYLYDITVYNASKDSYTPLCQVDETAVPAIAISNHWDPVTGDRIDDPDVVTFACQGAVLAKCIGWGYRPWAEGTRCDSQGQNCESVSLADYHQACTRMARADYCGDGNPHTLTGTMIDIFDSLSPSLQSRSTAENPAWGVEAEWGPDGAVCIGDSLRLQILEDNNVPYDVPACLDALDDLPDCGTFPDTRPDALVGDAYCEAWGTQATNCA